jgi:hypothetical protein
MNYPWKEDVPYSNLGVKTSKVKCTGHQSRNMVSELSLGLGGGNTLNVVEFSPFLRLFNRQYVLCIIDFSHTFWMTFFKLCTVVMYIENVQVTWSFKHFSKNLHAVELSHFFSACFE